MATDSVFVKEISATAITGKDAWNRPTPQPINISVSVKTDFQKASITDNLKYSVNYAVLTRNISDFMKSNEHKNFKSLGNIAESISSIVLNETKGEGQVANIKINSPKSEIRAESVEYEVTRNNGTSNKHISDFYRVNKLRLLTIIGVFTFERYQKQIVDVDLEFKIFKDDIKLDFHKIIADIVNYVENSNFKTVEALVFKIGHLVFQKYGKLGIAAVDVKATKPNAFSHVEGVGVSSLVTQETFRDAVDDDFSSADKSSSEVGFDLPVEDLAINDFTGEHEAFIAVGSNVGDQIRNINEAIGLLSHYKIRLEATSSLYISKPMYVLNQSDFLNGVIKVSFNDYSPNELLDILKKIEYNHIQREKQIDNGPRSIDLDILLYDNVQLNTKDLIIPHKLMLERTFVLQPLCELIPPDQIHPISAEPIHDHLQQLLMNEPDTDIQEHSRLLQINPVPRLSTNENILKFDQINFQSPTLIMGILNMTPDSFSDVGKYYNNELDKVVVEVEKMIDQGAQIIDIGGVSTRPGSVEPPEEEEIARVLPLVEKIRNSSNSKVSNVIISIDTYRSAVAKECLIAGADVINDISMGKYDENMFDVVAEFGCPYIMNHTRGTPKTMSTLTKYEPNKNDDIIEFIINPKVGQEEITLKPELTNLLNGVSREISSQIFKAFSRGVKKWQIILDPGVGFAKNLQQNLGLIQNASFFKKYSIQVNESIESSNSQQNHKHKYLSFNGMSLLIGTSRKKFLGTIIKQDENIPADRMMATAATVTACIEQHTDIIRVHDVKEINDVVKVSDAIYKGIT
ncbi:FOL1 [Candida pseudojiufengensis]|uniref:FOL1 n=1 Tax=Candida pseudojiufengensis TaxID=497109 RepID=UPI0022245549|nr:FOL1 [Candida pseudojiufengensis]KAI5964201.1 FOL1 [Candida pseudojiufengensis]